MKQLLCIGLALAGGTLAGASVAPLTGGGLGNMLYDYCTGWEQKQLEARQRNCAQIHDPEEVYARQRYIRCAVLTALGGLPAERTPLRPRTMGVIEGDQYRIEKVIYESQPGYFVAANVYVPQLRSEPCPAVIAPLGHYSEGKAAVEVQRMFGSLAQRGYVVLTFDPPDEGERVEYWNAAKGKSDIPLGGPSHTIAGLQCLLTGTNLARYEIWDAIRGIDYLIGRKDVDSHRIAVIGHSGGATQAAYLAVLDHRPAVIAASCYFTDWKALWVSAGPQDAEQDLVNFLRNGLDFADLAVAVAPKPYEILTATRDLFPVSGARRTYAEVRATYSILDASDHAGYFEAEDTHSWSAPRREATCIWLDRWLRHSEESRPEAETLVHSETALACLPLGAFVTELHTQTVQTLNAAHAAEIYPRREAARTREPAQVREIIARQLGMATSGGPVAAQLRGEVVCSSYRIEQRLIIPEPGIVLPTLVYLPSDLPFPRPALITVDEMGKAAESGPGGLLETMVRKGFVVVAADLRGLGDSRPAPRGKSKVYGERFDCDMRALLVGKSMAGMQVQDLLDVIDYTAARSEVDPALISVYGKGTAGAVAILASALRPMVRRVVADGAILSYSDIVRTRIPQDCSDLIIPGVLKAFDLPDAAAAIGSSKVFLIDPRTPDAHGAALETVRQEYGPSIHVSSEDSLPALLAF